MKSKNSRSNNTLSIQKNNLASKFPGLSLPNKEPIYFSDNSSNIVDKIMDELDSKDHCMINTNEYGFAFKIIEEKDEIVKNKNDLQGCKQNIVNKRGTKESKNQNPYKQTIKLNQDTFEDRNKLQEMKRDLCRNDKKSDILDNNKIQHRAKNNDMIRNRHRKVRSHKIKSVERQRDRSRSR
jgi:hypothetical protein